MCKACQGSFYQSSYSNYAADGMPFSYKIMSGLLNGAKSVFNPCGVNLGGCCLPLYQAGQGYLDYYLSQWKFK